MDFTIAHDDDSGLETLSIEQMREQRSFRNGLPRRSSRSGVKLSARAVSYAAKLLREMAVEAVLCEPGSASSNSLFVGKMQGISQESGLFGLSHGTFCVFDTFNDEEGRQKHLNGPIGQAIKAKTPELFSSPPSIEPVELLGSK